VYLRHSGKKWTSDVLYDAQHRFFSLPGLDRLKLVFMWFRRHLSIARHEAKMISEKVSTAIKQRSSTDSRTNNDVEANPVTANAASSKLISPPSSPATMTRSPMSPSRMSADIPIPATPSSIFGTLPGSSAHENESVTSLGHNGMTRGRLLWQNAIRTVRMQSAVSSNLAALAAKPKRSRTGSASNTTTAGERKKTILEEPVRMSRVKQLQPKIDSLEVTQDLPAHQGLVKHLQFSPDGKYLATSRFVLTCSLIIVFLG
jgi:WD repeat-containing protein 26